MKKFIISMCLLSITCVSKAQFSKLNDELFSAQIHLVDEFMSRFNDKKARQNLPAEYVSDARSNILLLFDLAKFKSRKDSLWLKAEAFAERVVSDNVQLHYEDSAWYAKALCRGMLQKKPVDFTLYLQVGKTAIGRYTWYIKKAEGKIFGLESDKKRKPFTLMPDDHETNFMSLYRMTDETSDYIEDFMLNNCEVDQTTVFMTLVKMNYLKIEYVKNLEFVFNQVPGYEFSIRYVSRENFNAGWLISSFKTLKENDIICKSYDVVNQFASLIRQMSEIKDFSVLNAIDDLFSMHAIVNDTVTRNHLNTVGLSHLRHGSVEQYEWCLRKLIKEGNKISLANIRIDKLDKGKENVSFVTADFNIEKDGVISTFPILIRIKDNRITHITDSTCKL